MPVLLTCRDTDHMRRWSSRGGLRTSAPDVPLSHGPTSASSRTTGIWLWIAPNSKNSCKSLEENNRVSAPGSSHLPAPGKLYRQRRQASPSPIQSLPPVNSQPWQALPPCWRSGSRTTCWRMARQAGIGPPCETYSPAWNGSRPDHWPTPDNARGPVTSSFFASHKR